MIRVSDQSSYSLEKLVEIDPLTANLTPIGSANGLTSTGFDILDDQLGFLILFDSNFNFKGRDPVYLPFYP